MSWQGISATNTSPLVVPTRAQQVMSIKQAAPVHVDSIVVCVGYQPNLVCGSVKERFVCFGHGDIHCCHWQGESILVSGVNQALLVCRELEVWFSVKL